MQKQTKNRLKTMLRFIPDKLYICLQYRRIIGRWPNLNNPQSFTEKLQWLKLHNRKSIYTTMVDKYEAKKYVASIIGEEYIIPTLGVWEHFDDIDFDLLPNRFVLKCTHDSGGLVICKDKSQFDKVAAKKKIEMCLKMNFYWSGREWPYKNVKPRIIAEEYMEDTETSELRDYRFFCFGGVAKCYEIDFNKLVKTNSNFYTMDGTIMKLGEKDDPPDFNKVLSVPINLEKMKEFAEVLSKNEPFLRADFYDVDGKVYFGELTFYHNSGFCKFIYEGNDELLGSWIKLPNGLGGGSLAPSH